MAVSDCEREVHVPATSLFSWLGRVRAWIPAACVLLLLLFVSLIEVDAALGRIEAPGYPSATLGSLRLDAMSQEAREDRRTAWCVWTETLPDETSPTRVQARLSTRGPPTGWMSA
ncbi:hypothetical protein ABZZ47_33345 [Streptomyces sp. NPDC006465]|uniref:hypothetical protein n=1 Tax=Streptomyces sp. NPDC006465 TaxID=3157174 RepID=UPI00339EAAD1